MRFQYDGLTFFIHMISYDVVQRSLSSIESQVGRDALYYVRMMGSGRAFLPWCILALATSVSWLPTWQKTASAPGEDTLAERRTLFKLLAVTLLPVVLFSLAITKHDWYVYSAYPFAALLLGGSLWRGYRRARRLKRRFPAWSILVCAIGIALLSEVNTLKRINKASATPNPVHAAMIELGRDPAARDATLFRAEGTWTQSDVLASRLYGPFTLATGGQAAYDAAKNQKKRFLLSIH